MVKFMKKLIPVMLLLIIVLAGILIYLSVTRNSGNDPTATPDPTSQSQQATNKPDETQETKETQEIQQTPSSEPAPTDVPAEATPSPEPVYSAVLKPYLTGEGSSSVTVSVKENLILAEYPYTANESLVKSLKLVLDGENIAKADFSVENIVPWQTYPVKITDTNGLTKDYVFTARPAAKNIPVVSVYSDAPVESRTEYVSGKIYVNSDNAEGYYGKNINGAALKIRGRGNASWSMTDKRSYRIKLDEKASVLGLRSNRDWVIVSTYFDKSLIRNVVAHSMAARMEYLYYTPTHVLVDFFLNGKYLGVYTVADKIEEAKNKVDIYNGSNPEEPGFMIEIGWDYSQPYVRDRDYFDTDVIIRLFVKEPDIPAANSPEILYIKDYIRKTEQAILAGEGYEKYLDVDSMVDWFIIAELTNNTEMGFYRSCYMYKPEGGKLIMGPVWDFDMAFGNHSGDIPGYDGWATAEATYWLVNDTWATYLIKDAKFMEKVKARWLEMRQTLLDTAYATIDTQYALVKESADANFDVWDILTKQVGEGTVDYTVYNTYEKQVQYVREFITKRAAWIDRRLGVNG
ncbi:MAG: CotH kinase family protein [Clostridia bacterium]|nr:CotH kinase family protein [Clostridia bacterium]